MDKTHTSEYGQEAITVSEKCPTFAIERKLGWTHVSTRPSEVEAMIRENVTNARNQGVSGWTKDAEEEAVRFALWRHEENRREYGYVMNGIKYV